MNQLEVEIKLPVGDLDTILQRLQAAGAVGDGPRAFEDNWVLDFADGRLRRQEIMLRLRLVEGGCTLTLKERCGDQGDYKIRREMETPVGDCRVALDMLQRLGLKPAYRYQKYRRHYRAGDLLITVDELPIGNYLELEGEPQSIDTFARLLGFQRADYINLSYRDLQIRQRQQQGQSDEPRHMLFPDRAS